MFVIVGIVVVIGAIVGGYLMEHGNLRVLLQPAELIIIGGAAAGTVLIANPLHILKKIISGITGAFGGSKYAKTRYMESLKMLFELFSRARKERLMALETDSDNPEQSPVFSKYPVFLKDQHVQQFVCDTIRMAAGGGIEPFDVDQRMELDMEVHHHNEGLPVAALCSLADSLPGLEIVAAVLGVVITLGGPPEEIGHKVAAALVGTFLGILLCYGFIGPLAANMAKSTEEEHAFYHVLRVVIVSFIKGSPPSIAVEFGRRAIPGHVRPTFQELENFVKEKAELQLRRLLSGAPHAQPASDHRQEEGQPRRSSRRRMESGLRRFCHRDDGVVHRALADEHQQANPEGRRRIFQRSHRNRQDGRQRHGRLWRELHRQERQHEGVDGAASEGHSRRPQFRQAPQPHRYDRDQRRSAHRIDGVGRRNVFRQWQYVISKDGGDILKTLAAELGKLPNHIAIEGHTDSKPYPPSAHIPTGSFRRTARMRRAVWCKTAACAEIKLRRCAASPAKACASPMTRRIPRTAESRSSLSM
jgi:chemotaxis protein MotA